jgi:hypothetical protein
MSISPGTLIYAVFACIAFALASSSLVHAVARHSPWTRRHRWAVIATATATPLLFFCAALGGLPAYGPLSLLHATLPIFCLTAIYGNQMSIYRQGVPAQLLGYVTHLWNAALFVLFSVRAAQVLFQVDLGDEFSSVLTCSALAQRSVGASEAELLPLWLPLPLLIPPLTSASAVALIYGSAAGFVASFWLGLHVLEFPSALEITQAMRRPTNRVELAMDRDIRLGMTMGSIEELPLDHPEGVLAVLGSPPALDGRIARAHELGLERLRLTVTLDTVLDPELFERAVHTRNRVREAELGLTVVIGAPSALAAPLPAAEQRKRAQQAQWIVSERLQPELLVLFSQPLTDPAMNCFGSLDAGRWADWITSCAQVVREGRPTQRCAVELTPVGSNALLLFDTLRRPNVELQEISFALDARRTAMPSLSQMLIELEGWLVSRPTAKTLSILGLPPAPLALGGMESQSSYVRRLIAFANDHREIRAADLGPMWDSWTCWNGYWDSRDVPRPALAELRSLVLQVHASPR